MKDISKAITFPAIAILNASRSQGAQAPPATYSQPGVVMSAGMPAYQVRKGDFLEEDIFCGRKVSFFSSIDFFERD